MEVLYNGTGISTDIAPYVLDFSCTDNAGDKADDISLTLENRDRIWTKAWAFAEGDKLRVSIDCENWLAQGDSYSYACGTYSIDEIEDSGPPSVVAVRAVSSTVTESLRREQKTRAWENLSLQDIAGDLSGEHGLGLLYDAPAVRYERRDQRHESDLAFLSRLAKEAGCRVKVAEEQLILFHGQTYDAKSPGLILTPRNLASWKLKSQSHSVYNACKVDYWNPSEKVALTHTYTPPNAPPSGQVLKINKRVESLAAAEELAKSELRAANEHQATGALTFMADPRLFAGSTVELSGFGVLSGAYFIEKITHSYNKSNGWRMSTDVRKILEY